MIKTQAWHCNAWSSYAWAWAIFNVLIGVYEVYCYQRRHLGVLGMTGYSDSSITDGMQHVGWNMYCAADPRYLLPHSEYVWYFELANAGLALAFFLAMALKVARVYLKGLLVLQVYGCLFYFLSFLDDDLVMRASERLIDPFWRQVYFGISAMWIVVPLLLLTFA